MKHLVLQFGVVANLYRQSILGILGFSVTATARYATFLAPSHRRLSQESATNEGSSVAAVQPHPAQNSYHHVVYTADAQVFEALLRSMLSLTLHLSEPGSCVIHLIVPTEDLQRAQVLADCFRCHVNASSRQAVPQVSVHEVKPMPFQADYRDRPDLRGHTAAFARLFLPEYLPHVRRVVYLDADTLVMGDVAPLFTMPMNHTIAAVAEDTTFRETWEKWLPGLSALVSKPDERSIFNDGVLVVNLERWRSEHIAQDMQDWSGKVGAKVDDQLFLNLEFQVRKAYDVLPHEWNDFRLRPTGWPEYGWSDELQPEDPLSNAKIIHWTGPKPWSMPTMRDAWMKAYQHLWEVPGAAPARSCDAAQTARK